MKRKKEDDYQPKNSWGLPIHEADEFTHWTDKVEEVVRIRETWDTIPKKYRDQVRFFIERGKHLADMSNAEQAAGEAL
jgi:glucuronate isomerase